MSLIPFQNPAGGGNIPCIQLANHVRRTILKQILTHIPDERGSELRTETAGGEGPQLLPSVTSLSLFLSYNWLTDLAVERPQKRTTFNK